MTLNALPDYDAAGIARLNSVTAELLDRFAAADFVRVDPPVIEPADIFLDRSGEEIRRRTFFFNDPAGTELALRPDMTVPVCRHFVRSGEKQARLAYAGQAFRVPRPDAEAQFVEAGIERFGDSDAPKADAEVLALTLDALKSQGLQDFKITMGDIGLFQSFVDGLDMPDRWRARLKRRFWRPADFADLVERLATDGTALPMGDAERGAGFVAALAALDDVEARRAAVADLLSLADVKPAGGRSEEDIARRLLDLAEDQAADALSAEVKALLDGYLDVSGTAPDALGALQGLANKGKAYQAALSNMQKRIDALQQAGIDPDAIGFETTFGRQMDYYTGFVFEVRVDALGPIGQIAGGGRYDNLVQDLGAPEPVAAVGAMIRPERLIKAVYARGAK